jgi:hypothetical protein
MQRYWSSCMQPETLINQPQKSFSLTEDPQYTSLAELQDDLIPLSHPV